MRALQAPGPRPLPRAELKAAGEAREAMVPLFLAHIDRLTGAGLDAADDPAFIFVYHLLAEWGETRAYRPLLRLLRGDPEFVDTLMGDGITESGARVVVRLFDGDLGPIFEAALDSEAEEYVRGQMLDALAMLAGEHAPLRPAVADFLRSFPAAVAPEMTPDIVWHAWADAIADLGLADMTPVVRRVYDEGLIDPTLASFEDFEQDLTETLTRTTRHVRQARAGRRRHRRAVRLVLLLGGLSPGRGKEGEAPGGRAFRRRAAVHPRRREGGPQRSLSVWQRQEVQEVLPGLT